MCLKEVIAGISLLAMSMPAIAGQGEVCASTARPASYDPLTNDTVFNCKLAGKGTVSQLYSKGWRVVSVFPQVASAPGQQMTSHWVIVIEKA